MIGIFKYLLIISIDNLHCLKNKMEQANKLLLKITRKPRQGAADPRQHCSPQVYHANKLEK